MTNHFFSAMASKKSGGHKVISAQCPECQSDVISNKRGCGSLVKAQASARVDVRTAAVFLQCEPRSPTRVQVFVRMLGHVHDGQPTVNLTVPTP